MAQTNSPVVSVLGWFTHLKHYLYQQYLEANSKMPVPPSCRGIPHSIDRVQIPDVPAGWHPTDDELRAAIDKGIDRAIALLTDCGVSTNLTRLNGFFKQPCKHYPLRDRIDADTYVAAVNCEEADRGDKEDDPNGNTPDGETVDLTTMDAQDAADAEAVITQLMRDQLGEDDQGEETGVTECAKRLMQEISALLSNFNQTIQEEAKDRKYRFIVKRLMKEHQRAGDTLDEELDFYRDDDDVAILFTMPDGSHCWALGNIEEVAQSTQTVNQNTATGANGSSYLLNLDKTYKPQGIYVDDPKGLFIVRWYTEVDKDGKELINPRYQNPKCAGYKLMANNDGATFCWTSNYQLVSKVYLKKVLQPRTYTLTKKDTKMVQTVANAKSGS